VRIAAITALVITALALLPAGSAGGAGKGRVRTAQTSCANLGVLENYEVFVSGYINVNNDGMQGPAAAYGDIKMSGYSVSGGLAPDPARLDLIAGGNLTAFGVHANGSVRYGGTLIGGVGVPAGATVSKGRAPFELDDESARMQLLSAEWGALPGIEVKKQVGEVLALTGESTGLNVFHVTTAILQGARNITISVPAGGSALIDVSGPSYSTSLAGTYAAGNSAVPTIWNFTGATTVHMGGLNWYGTVLAPDATINASSGQLFGRVWGDDWTGSATLQHGLQPACMPPPTAQTMLLTAMCVDFRTNELAIRVRNVSEANKKVTWRDLESAQTGSFELLDATDQYFHVLEGNKPHKIVVTDGVEEDTVEGTTRPCEATIEVHKTTSGEGTPPAGPWKVRVTGTSGFVGTQEVLAGGTVAFKVPGTYEAGTATTALDPGGYNYTVTEEDPQGAVATVTPELVPINDGQGATVEIDNRYDPPAVTPPAPEPPAPKPPAIEPPAPLPGEPQLPPLTPAPPHQAAADLVIAEAIRALAVPTHVTVGKKFEVTVHVSNRGSLPAVGVVATELPQANRLHPNLVAQVLSVAGAAPGTCTHVRPVTCNLGTLQPGADVAIHARAKALTTGALTSILRVSSTTPELNTTNNMVMTGVDFVPQATKLSVKVSAPSRGRVGGKLSYRVRAKVGRAAPARFVRLCQKPPTGLRITSAPKTFRHRGSICRNFKKIPAGGSAGFTVNGVPGTKAAGRTLSLTAQASAPSLKTAKTRRSIAIR
jgi:choice-of-anchor A domain-containing protein